MAQPQSLPEGDSSSAGIMVSTAATTKACSVSLSRSSGSACGAAGGVAAAGACASAGAVWVKPVATAVPARPAPTRNFRRGIVSSVIAPSLPAPIRAAIVLGWNDNKLDRAAGREGRARSIAQNRVDECFRIGAKLPHQAVVIRFADTDWLEPVFGKPQQLRRRISHEHGRVRGHDDLANPGFVHALEQLEELDLPRRRQRRFRLIEDEYALPLAAFIEETQKTLAVRMRKKIRRLRAGIER